MTIHLDNCVNKIRKEVETEYVKRGEEVKGGERERERGK
jgi:hypothetical protein